ncbi:5-oxoprolinase subunit C family protein [Aquibacillus kalidii]|uniref:5-oxoprolinase subunit C family protein n=1 Tax=Aquibacillus kalidii TaxID=2762597 RepID=UPI0016484CCF|nr:biotin-dependent carboxyltransferase family protein [Aquibacillus kalidii]
MGLRMIEEGLLTTVQDLGRKGYQSLGFSVNGPMDQLAMRLANIILGNDQNEAVLEMSFLGPSISFESDMIIALTGADMSPRIDDVPVSLGKPLAVKTGQTLQLRTSKSGLYSYLAVKGGLDIPEVLNSKSTSLTAQVGGYNGRKLQTGDFIPIKKSYSYVGRIPWQLDSTLFAYLRSEKPIIRFLEGKQYKSFSSQSLDNFTSKQWKISTKSNRMGYRLIGAELLVNDQKELITEATAFGTIQVPPNGQPIVLMADRQPTGGYPKIGQVIQADLPKLSQLRPTQAFHFQKSSIEEALTELKITENTISRLKVAIASKWKEWENAYC